MGRYYRTLSTNPRSRTAPSWVGATIWDALQAGSDDPAGPAGRAAPPKPPGGRTAPPAPPTKSAWRTLHLDGPSVPAAPEAASYLSVATPDLTLTLHPLVENPATTLNEVLPGLLKHPVICLDGLKVAQVLDSVDMVAPPSLICLTTMVKLLENRAWPEEQKRQKPKYELADIRTRLGRPGDPVYENPACWLARTYPRLSGDLARSGLIQVWALERQLQPVTGHMQRAGLGIDAVRMQTVQAGFAEQAATVAAEFRRLVGSDTVNIDYQEEVLQTLKNAGVAVQSTSAEDLALVGHPAAETLGRYRKLNSIRLNAEQCLSHLGPDGRIRAEWDALPGGAGRMSCSRPALQSLCKEPLFRQAIIPAPDYAFVQCDLAQADLRPLAFLAKDECLIDALQVGRDFHRHTTAGLLSKDPDQVTAAERCFSKALIYGIVYAMGTAEMARQAQVNYGLIWSRNDAAGFLQRLLSLYPGIRRFQADCREKSLTATEARTIAYRRRRLLPEGAEHQHYRYTRLLNTPAQGTVADAVKEAMIAIDRKLGSSGVIILNLHDELVVEAVEAQAEDVARLVETEMVRALERVLPGVPVEAKARVTKDLSK